MQDYKKFAFDIGITFFASAITIPLGFIITLLLGRYLGADDLGLYRMALTIYGIALIVAAFGIPAVIIKYVAEYKNNRTRSNQIISSGIITALFLGIGYTALFYFLSGIFAEMFNMPELSNLLKILSIVFPFALVNGALLGLLNGIREMKKHAVTTIINSVLMVIFTVTLIFYGFGAVGAVIGLVLSSVCTLFYLIFITKKYFEITFNEYVPTTKSMLSFGSKIIASNAINQVNYHADILLVGYFLTAKDVGYYAVAVGLSKFFWIIPQAFQKITYPATSEFWANNNHSALQLMIDKSMKYSACILLPIGLTAGFFANDIITMMFGDKFIFSVSPLLILLIGAIINGATTRAIGSSLTGVGRPDLPLKMVGISATINIILNVLFIPYLGIAGAAIATTTSLLVSTFLTMLLTIKILKVKIDFRWYVEIFGITLLSILAFMYLSFFNRIFVGIFILCIYVLIIIIFLLTKEDRKYFMELIPKIHPFK